MSIDRRMLVASILAVPAAMAVPASLLARTTGESPAPLTEPLGFELVPGKVYSAVVMDTRPDGVSQVSLGWVQGLAESEVTEPAWSSPRSLRADHIMLSANNIDWFVVDHLTDQHGIDASWTWSSAI